MLACKLYGLVGYADCWDFTLKAIGGWRWGKEDVRKDCLLELKKINAAWPDLNYATPEGCLGLRPSSPPVPKQTPVTGEQPGKSV